MTRPRRQAARGMMMMKHGDRPLPMNSAAAGSRLMPLLTRRPLHSQRQRRLSRQGSGTMAGDTSRTRAGGDGLCDRPRMSGAGLSHRQRSHQEQKPGLPAARPTAAVAGEATAAEPPAQGGPTMLNRLVGRLSRKLRMTRKGFCRTSRCSPKRNGCVISCFQLGLQRPADTKSSFCCPLTLQAQRHATDDTCTWACTQWTDRLL